MSSVPCRERTGSKLCNTRNTLFSRKSNAAMTIGLKWSKSREILWFWSLFVVNEDIEILLQWTCFLIMCIWEDKVENLHQFSALDMAHWIDILHYYYCFWNIMTSILLRSLTCTMSKWTVSDDDPINCKRDQTYEHNVSSKSELHYMNRHHTFVTTSKSILGSIGLELQLNFVQL